MLDLHKSILLKRPVRDSFVSLVLPGCPQGIPGHVWKQFWTQPGGTTNISWVEAWDASENPTMPRTAPSPPLQGAPGVHPHRQRCAEKPWAKYHNYCTTVNSEYQGRLLLLLNPLSHLLHEELMDNLRHPDSAMGRDTSVLHTSCRGSPLDVFCLCFSFFLFLLL